MMAGEVGVVGGVDPHADTIHVAVITTTGRRVADREFATTADGYAAALAWLRAQGWPGRVGVEGSAGYGAGVTRALTAAGAEVVEVERPTRSARRRAGKSDRLDAYHAARAVLAERFSPVKNPAIDGVRALHVARRTAVQNKTQAINQIRGLLVMADDLVRARFAVRTAGRLVSAILASGDDDDTMIALRVLAERYRRLDQEVRMLTRRLGQRVRELNPRLLEVYGVGPDSAAQLLITAGMNPDRLRSEASLAALCGTAPVPASSGKTTRYRLSRGGDRAANAALHRIALVRLSHDHPATRAYAAKQQARHRSGLELIRLLKRALIRELFKVLRDPIPAI